MGGTGVGRDWDDPQDRSSQTLEYFIRDFRPSGLRNPTGPVGPRTGGVEDGNRENPLLRSSRLRTPPTLTL